MTNVIASDQCAADGLWTSGARSRRSAQPVERLDEESARGGGPRATRLPRAAAFFLFALAGCAANKGDDSEVSRVAERAYLGGIGGTVFDASSNAFKRPVPGLSDEDFARHAAGDEQFDAKFVTAPAPINPGLGPLFNNVSCDSCHLKEGRGSPVLNDPARGGSQLLVLLQAVNGEPEVPNGTVPVPGLGFQVLDQAVQGAAPNATAALTWVEEPGTFGDGTPYSLRKPVITVTMPDGKALPANVNAAPRQPPPVYGLGLLEAVPEGDILALATAPGKIPGRANIVWSRIQGKAVLGRFGRKAQKPSIREQAAQAFARDIGVTNELFPDGGAAPELTNDAVDDTAFYLTTIGVPARRGVDDPAVVRGEARFHDFGCVGCHVTQMKTGPHAVASLSEQTIRPYSDLLLHDLGEGLADGRQEFGASGSEWRTAALWGIGLAQTVHPYASFLHDGRARTLDEAILWHGGQAKAARETFRTATAKERAELLTFLRSL